MTMMPYTRPFSLLNQLQRDINDLFMASAGTRADDQSYAADWVPAVDIKEEKDRYIIEADVPGIQAKDIEVTMENHQLTIRGQREHVKEEERGEYKRVERVRGSFVRSFTLPDVADTEHIRATTKDGVLTVVIPKSPKATPRRIQVES